MKIIYNLSNKKLMNEVVEDNTMDRKERRAIERK